MLIADLQALTDNSGEAGRVAANVLEVALDYFTRVKPFVRFMYNALVVPLRSSAEGTLANSAWFFSAGARLSIVEVHLSNIQAREPFRRHSYFSDLAVGTICGLGGRGYEAALEFALSRV